MKFLCTDHTREMAGFSARQKSDLWVTWMNAASSHADQDEWRQVVSFSGCAFDLASLSLSHGHYDMSIEMTLSAICLAEAFERMRQPDVAEEVIRILSRRLVSVAPPDFLAALQDADWRRRFFRDYLSWPAFQPESVASQGSPTVH